MKRFVFLLTTVAALAIFSTSSANAADSYYGHGGHRSYAGHGFVGTYGYGFAGYGYAVPSYGHGYVQYGHAAPAYGGHGYNRSYGRSYGHRGGFQISTPRFGLRLGH